MPAVLFYFYKNFNKTNRKLHQSKGIFQIVKICPPFGFLWKFRNTIKKMFFLLINEVICLFIWRVGKLKCWMFNHTGAISSSNYNLVKSKIQAELTVFNKSNMESMGILCIFKLGLLFLLWKKWHQKPVNRTAWPIDNKRC